MPDDPHRPNNWLRFLRPPEGEVSDTFTITRARSAGEKDNPHGGKLVKWYIGLSESAAGEEDVYVQKKPGNDLSQGMEISGRLEKGEYGWRLFPEGQQQGNSQPSQGTFTKDDYWRNKDQRDIEGNRRMGRAHAQEMALRMLALPDAQAQLAESWDEIYDLVREWTDWFERDVDVGGGSGDSQDALSPATAVRGAADVSADTRKYAQQDREPEEASPAQKRKLTQLFNQARLAREAQMAIVLFRCHQKKATKDGASQLITDLSEGATAESLLAEIWDAHRAGNPLGTRASKLIPQEVPADDDGLPELSPEDKAKYGAEEDVPF